MRVRRKIFLKKMKNSDDFGLRIPVLQKETFSPKNGIPLPRRASRCRPIQHRLRLHATHKTPENTVLAPPPVSIGPLPPPITCPHLVASSSSKNPAVELTTLGAQDRVCTCDIPTATGLGRCEGLGDCERKGAKENKRKV